MAIDPFKSTSYTVARIVNAIASDTQGNLILRDLLNPEGVTLTSLIQGLVATNVTFNSTGTFFAGASTVQDALEQLNQFAYMNQTGRFIIVDPTIDDSLTVSGKIYNDIATAVNFANTLLVNGYNKVNVLLMGSHAQNPETEISSDLGVFEYDASTIEEINLYKNGIKLIGVGNPIIRFSGITAESNLFVVGTETTQELSVFMQDISFEFVNSRNVTAISVYNSPNNSNLKDKNGLFIDGISCSFYGGTNTNNRIVGVVNSGTPKKSNIKIKNFRMGSILSATPSATPIELIYVNHNDETVVNIENMEFVNVDQPNPVDVTTTGTVTSITAIKLLKGKIIVNNAKLDEKMYWKNETFTDVKTLFLDIENGAEATISNASVIRDTHNTTEEKIGGITTLNDWIEKGSTAKVNAQGGFDEIFDISIIPIQSTTPAPSSVGASSSPTTGSPTTGGPEFLYDVKPVKGFYNDSSLALGVGDKNEIRIGIVDSSDIQNFTTYTRKYGAPLGINSTDKKIYYAVDGYLFSVGNNKYSVHIEPSDWSGTGPYEFTITHNLNLVNKYAFNISAFNATTNKMITLDEVEALNKNSCKVTLAANQDIWITILN